MVTALLFRTVTRELTEPQCIRTIQKFHHKFSVFECMKIAQNYAQVSLPLSHTMQYSKMFFFFFSLFFLLEGTFSLEKWKSKWPTVRNMCFQKLWKILRFQNKMLLVMFYRHNKTFWYQFCNFKHFLKAENSEDSLASSCEEFTIGTNPDLWNMCNQFCRSFFFFWTSFLELVLHVSLCTEVPWRIVRKLLCNKYRIVYLNFYPSSVTVRYKK